MPTTVQIQIIGDMPIYVSFDSADAWSNPLLFQFNEKNQPLPWRDVRRTILRQRVSCGAIRCIAGSITGKQATVGGFPGCSTACVFTMWCVSTISAALTSIILCLLEKRQQNFGHWEKGPGLELFRALQEKVENLQVIAEDLGFLTESVIQLVKDTGYPGMKVLEFAFDSDPTCLYLPHNIPQNSINYTGNP